MAWLEQKMALVVIYQKYKIREDYMRCALFAHTLQGKLLDWCATLPKKFIHSITQFIEEISEDFHRFDHQALNK